MLARDHDAIRRSNYGAVNGDGIGLVPMAAEWKREIRDHLHFQPNLRALFLTRRLPWIHVQYLVRVIDNSF